MEKDSNKGTKAFQCTIEEYLKGRAESDPLFAETYKKENKNIEDCCNYIISEVQKSGKNGFTDDEIFSIAVHYYDEDDIGKPGAKSCKVVVNHVVELTEEEKKVAKDQAMAKVMEEQRQALKSRDKKQRKADGPTMFDLFGDL